MCLDATNVKSFRGEPTVNYAVGVSPWTNGGINTNITGTYEDDGPVTNSNTWKFEKTGGSYQWNGWESNYGGIWTGNAGDYWTTSYWYKTTSPAGIGGFGVGSFYKSDWSAPYNVTIIGGDNSIIADGEWHYNYTTSQINENYSNAIIVDGPSWGYNNIPGTLYINGLQWEKKAYPTAYSNGTRGTTVATGGGLKDLSRFGNHGFLNNGPIYNPSTNGMLTFDGVDAYIRANITETQITTVDIWFYTPIQITSGGLPIGYGGLGNYGTSGVINQYDGFIFGDWTGGANNETIGYYQHNPPGFIYIKEVIPAGYHNIVMNYNITDATYDFFLNGNKVTRYTATQGIVGLISTDVVVLGCTGDPETVGSPYYGSCGIMNVKVYNRVLTEPEIKQNYNATKQRFTI
jgi:hypothetical protein